MYLVVLKLCVNFHKNKFVIGLCIPSWFWEEKLININSYYIALLIMLHHIILFCTRIWWFSKKICLKILKDHKEEMNFLTIKFFHILPQVKHWMYYTFAYWLRYYLLTLNWGTPYKCGSNWVLSTSSISLLLILTRRA